MRFILIPIALCLIGCGRSLSPEGEERLRISQHCLDTEADPILDACNQRCAALSRNFKRKEASECAYECDRQMKLWVLECNNPARFKTP